MIRKRYTEGWRTGREREADTALLLLSSTGDCHALNSGDKIVAMVKFADSGHGNDSSIFTGDSFPPCVRSAFSCLKPDVSEVLDRVDHLTVKVRRPIIDQISRRRVLGEGLPQLLRNPSARWMSSDFPIKNAPAVIVRFGVSELRLWMLSL